MKVKSSIFFILFFFQVVISGNTQCYLKEVPSYGTPLSTTGSTKLDEILTSETMVLQQLFEFYIDLYAFDDSESPNAFAVPAADVILIGKTLMLDELAKTNNSNSIKAILAHEFAHILQHKWNLNESGTWTGKWPELHADYLAGWYIGKKRYLTYEQVKTIAFSFWDLGDENYFSPNHHGTKQERALAFFQGFLNADFSLVDAYVYGANFIANINLELEKVSNYIKNKSTQPQAKTAYEGYIFQVTKTTNPFGEGINQFLFLYPDVNGKYTFQNCLYKGNEKNAYSYSTGYASEFKNWDFVDKNSGIKGMSTSFKWNFSNSYDFESGFCDVQIDFYSEYVNGSNLTILIKTEKEKVIYNGIWKRNTINVDKNKNENSGDTKTENKSSLKKGKVVICKSDSPNRDVNVYIYENKNSIPLGTLKKTCEKCVYGTENSISVELTEGVYNIYYESKKGGSFKSGMTTLNVKADYLSEYVINLK